MLPSDWFCPRGAPSSANGKCVIIIFITTTTYYYYNYCGVSQSFTNVTPKFASQEHCLCILCFNFERARRFTFSLDIGH